ncbi:gram-negative bacteria binding protein 3 [Glossina fuscipes fuscipes]
MFKILSVLFLHYLLASGQAYDVPKAKIEVNCSKGFQVSIPHADGITLFAFHAKLNEEMDGLEGGTWSRDIVKPKNGSWTFTDRITKLELGDTLYYWTYVIYQGLGYREDDGVYIVNRCINSNTTVPGRCEAPFTKVNGSSVTCRNELLFEENFDDQVLDSNKWKLEERRANQPDYEFCLYKNDESEVLRLHDGMATIKPKKTDSILGANSIRKNFDVGPNCTGELGSVECHYEYGRSPDILEPYISAQFSTKKKFTFQYGRVEIRAKLPNTKWVFPQIWLEPTSFRYGHKDYQSGQIRLADNRFNGHKYRLQAGVILNAKEPWRSLKMCKIEGNQSIDDFHLYVLMWTPNYMAFSKDGDEYCRIEIQDDDQAFQNLRVNNGKRLPNRELLTMGTKWAPFDQEFYITLGYGIGGNNDFNDNTWYEGRPWTESDPRAKNVFWNYMRDRDEWLNNGELKIDFIRVYAI